MKTYFLDTNAILRVILGDDKKQVDQVKLIFQKAENKQIKIYLIAEVIAEIIYILSKYYGVPKNECVLATSEILKNNYINIFNQDKQILLNAVEIYSSSQIDFIDSLLIANVSEEDANLLTFDKKMLKVLANLTNK